MTKLFFTIFLSILWAMPPLAAQEYLRAKAKRGDGIYHLLGRYGLDNHSCNLKQFCQLNKLKTSSYLMEGRSYKLPIQKYRYNNKSIRSSIGKNDWFLAKQIERFNDKMLLQKHKKEDFRRGSKELWVPHHLLFCNINPEKFVPKNRKFPILGPKYANVPLKDKQLAGAVYYLVSGHGGPDPGASSTYKGQRICEDEYAYDITLRLARRLLEHGAIVYIITRDKTDGIRDYIQLKCDETETCWENQKIPVDQKQRLTQRSDIINKLYRSNQKKGITYQRLIEIHVDSRSKSQRIDLFFYHYPGSRVGKSLAETLHKTIQSKYAIHRRSGKYSGDVSARDLHMLREVSPTPAVFIEVGNIQNKADQKRILLPRNRQALADWLSVGLLKDY